MSKFKVGDRVEWVAESKCTNYSMCGGSYMVITKVVDDGDYYWYDIFNNSGDKVKSCLMCSTGDDDGNLKLVTKGGEVKPYQRKTYRLKKALPTLKPGALFQEECDDGTQPYKLITPEFAKYDGTSARFTIRASVEEEPGWFEEVFKVTPEYMTQPELDEWEAFKKTKTPKAAKRKAGRPTKTK